MLLKSLHYQCKAKYWQSVQGGRRLSAIILERYLCLSLTLTAGHQLYNKFEAYLTSGVRVDFLSEWKPFLNLVIPNI